MAAVEVQFDRRSIGQLADDVIECARGNSGFPRFDNRGSDGLLGFDLHVGGDDLETVVFSDQHGVGQDRDGISALDDRLDVTESARSEEHTSELQSLMRISYAVFCLKKKNNINLNQQK